MATQGEKISKKPILFKTFLLNPYKATIPGDKKYQENQALYTQVKWHKEFVQDLEGKNFSMDLVMKVFGRTMSTMAQDVWYTQTETNTKDNLKMTKELAKEQSSTQVVENISGYGITIDHTDLVKRLGRTEFHIQANTIKVGIMGKVL